MTNVLGPRARPSTWIGKALEPRVTRWLSTIVLGGTVVLGSISVWRFDGHSASPESLLVIPVALCAIGFGVRGGVAAAPVALATSAAWRFSDSGASNVDLATHAVTFVLIGLLVGWFVDERRALVSALQRHEELSLDLLVEANFDGYFTRVNPAWKQILGYDDAELLSRPFLEFVYPDDRPATIEATSALSVEGDLVVRFQNRYRHKDGSYRWLEWNARPDPRRQRIVAIAREITDRKQTEQERERYKERLEQAVKERTQALEQRTEELEEARLEMLYRLALAAEYRDDQTFEHTNRVSRMAAALAVELGLDRAEVDLIEQAALLHDIGKLGVSDTILLKPGKLTPAEWHRVQRHTLDGARILSGSQTAVLRMAEEIALSHHEWWDGTGYPRGLRGDAIPLPAQLVAVADVFDALTHKRPYKPAWPVSRAIAEIIRLRGRQFGPAVVDAFERLDHGTRRTSEDHAPTRSAAAVR